VPFDAGWCPFAAEGKHGGLPLRAADDVPGCHAAPDYTARPGANACRTEHATPNACRSISVRLRFGCRDKPLGGYPNDGSTPPRARAAYGRGLVSFDPGRRRFPAAGKHGGLPLRVAGGASPSLGCGYPTRACDRRPRPATGPIFCETNPASRYVLLHGRFAALWMSRHIVGGISK